MEHQDHWADLGGRVRWMGLPQVPGPAIARQAAELCQGGQGLSVLLGVTPAYADLGDTLLAFDASRAMIAAIWPGDTERRQAQLADWTALPVASGSAARVLGDGSLNSVPDRATLGRVLTEVRRLLGPAGRAAIRVFVRPDPAETPAKVLSDARAGRFASLNVLRWRLASALATAPSYQVAVADILTAASALGDLVDFAQGLGQNPEEAAHFLAYAGSPAVYLFPDRSALVDDAARAGLTCRWVETTGYPGADCCPFAVFTHRA